MVRHSRKDEASIPFVGWSSARLSCSSVSARQMHRRNAKIFVWNYSYSFAKVRLFRRQSRANPVQTWCKLFEDVLGRMLDGYRSAQSIQYFDHQVASRPSQSTQGAAPRPAQIVNWTGHRCDHVSRGGKSKCIRSNLSITLSNRPLCGQAIDHDALRQIFHCVACQHPAHAHDLQRVTLRSMTRMLWRLLTSSMRCHGRSVRFERRCPSRYKSRLRSATRQTH